MIWLILLSVLIGWSIKVFLVRPKHPHKTLPGPYGVPLLGYLPFLTRKPYVTFMKLKEKYGEVFQLNLAGRTVIVLASEQAIKDALSKDLAFAGRPDTPTFRTIAKSGQSRFAFKQGDEQWRFLRKAAVKSLSMFASSRNSRLSEVVDDACGQLHLELKEQRGKPFNPQLNIFNCVAGVIGAVLFGTKFDVSDPLLKGVVTLTRDVSRFVEVGNIIDSIPYGHLLGQKRQKDFLSVGILTNLPAITPVNEMAERHILSLDHSFEGEVRDVADALYVASLDEDQTQRDKLGITRNQVRFITQDLFGAGFGTTMETMRWGCNLLAAFPEVQKKAQSELDTVLRGEPVTLDNRIMLPYCEATLMEVLRFSSLIPLSIPHSVQVDTELYGYHIPKGAMVLPNLYGVHYNSDIFPEPDDFRPERFLTKEGKIDSDVSQHIVSFGVGKRRCVGENLARQELFILLSRTLQQFFIKPQLGTIVNVWDVDRGFTRRPIESDLMFIARESNNGF